MLHVLGTSNYRLSLQHAVVLGSTMFGVILDGIEIPQNASPCLILVWCPKSILSFRSRRILLDRNYFYLGSRPLTVNFYL